MYFNNTEKYYALRAGITNTCGYPISGDVVFQLFSVKNFSSPEFKTRISL